VSTTITPKHLTIADLCEELGIARSTFYDWRAKGRAPRCIKLPNGDLRIRRTEFERWLTEHEDAATSWANVTRSPLPGCSSTLQNAGNARRSTPTCEPCSERRHP
jgi:predicted DNA-binding transcriptional regulator AlpA